MIPRKAFTVLLCAGWTAAAAFASGAELVSPPEEIKLRRSAVVTAVQKSGPAVINISAKKRVVRRDFFWDLYEDTATSIGSGAIFHPDGYAVTNTHVVGQAREIEVRLLDKRRLAARVLAVDQLSDLAVLKIEGGGPFPVLSFGTSSDLMVGETVIAMGNPFGFAHTVSDGVISALHRSLAGSSLKDVIQTSASINPGNSGGPLLNIAGRLVGINTAIRREAQNIGFAIPVDRVRESLCLSLDAARLANVAVGAKVADGPALGEVRVAKVLEEGLKDIRPGDIVLEVDGKPCRLAVYWNIALLGKKPGDMLAAKFRRGKEEFTANLPVRKAPKKEPNAIIEARLGLHVQALYASLAKRFNGVFVARVTPGGLAERTGIQVHEIIESIAISGSTFTLSTPQQLADLLSRVKTGATVGLNIMQLKRSGSWIRINKRTVQVTIGSRARIEAKEEI